MSADMTNQTTPVESHFSLVHILGAPLPCGVYLLGIRLTQPEAITFGRYNQGHPVAVPAGEFLYIGSASGQKGSSTLAARLMRHTCRSGTKPHHPIQPILRHALQTNGLAANIPRRKTVHWHIDYLLEKYRAELFAILAYRTSQNIEHGLAETLAAQPETSILADGLGASDHPGGTHLLRVHAARSWWEKLPDLLSQMGKTTPSAHSKG
jgi:Uri superfamily endonuclease